MAYTATYGATYDAALNVAALSEQLKRQVDRFCYWTRMTADMSQFKKGDEVKPGVVMLKNELKTKGGDTIKVPFALKLSGEPIYGDNQGEGNEESFETRYLELRINRVKKLVRSEGRMSDFRIKKLQIFNGARPALAQWWTTEKDFEHYRALTRRYSNSLLAPEVDGGININSGTQVSHPNLLVAGYSGGSDDATFPGLVAWNATASSYETNVATCIAAQPSSSNAYMSLRLVDIMDQYLEPLGIEPIIVDGQEYYILLLDRRQWMQMRSVDSKLFSTLENIDAGLGQKSAIFSGAKYRYGKFIIHENGNIPGVSASGSTVTYGLASSRTRDTYNNRIGFVLGQGALGYAVGESLRYDDRAIDYNSYLGIQASEMFGVVRADWLRDDGISQTSRVGVNVSSMMFVTYTPYLAFSSATPANI